MSRDMMMIRPDMDKLLERKITKADLRWVKLMEHLGMPDVTEDEVDEALDAR